MNEYMQLEQRFGAGNYLPLPVVLTRGEGVYVWDDADKRYLDMMSAYSAVSHGHCHPRLVKALKEQAECLTIVSRAYYTNQLGAFLKRVCELTHMDRALPMNTGAEAVETALKAARKWAYEVKKVPQNAAEIIVCQGNFHGRTITIVGMSSEKHYQFGFGPFPAGFRSIPYGDSVALEQAITPNTAAFLVEPVQGEAGIKVPPPGYLRECQKICQKQNVLLICDEIQCGLARTGKVLASMHEDVHPDGLILGKALGGGMLPVSLFLGCEEVIGVFDPGSHGSTFGGNPLAAHIALEALNILIEDDYCQRSAQLGKYFIEQLRACPQKIIKEIRGLGLFIGVEIDPKFASAREICLKLLAKGVLSKETHDTVVRLAPPLVITQAQIDTAVQALREVLAQYDE